MADPFEGWAIAELFGRRRLAGYVRADAPLLQATRLQIDIYAGDAGQPAATMGVPYPVYCLTSCTEALARRLGADTLASSMPVAQWELTPAQPPAEPRALDPWLDPDPVADASVHSADCEGGDCEGECDGDG
jgi:hypothetical protein